MSVLLNLLLWMGVLLGVLLVSAIWLALIYIVVDEIIGLFKDTNKEENEEWE